MIHCDLCKVGYNTISKDTKQAHECSSFVIQGGILGAYGSLIDMQYWRWTDGIPPVIENVLSEDLAGTVLCDTCVQTLMNQKLIEYGGEEW